MDAPEVASCRLPEKRIWNEEGRRSDGRDWNGVSEYCNDRRAGNMFMCKYFNVVAHKECVMRTHCDLPQQRDGSWTCCECAREIESVQHVNCCCDTVYLNDIDVRPRCGVLFLTTAGYEQHRAVGARTCDTFR